MPRPAPGALRRALLLVGAAAAVPGRAVAAMQGDASRGELGFGIAALVAALPVLVAGAYAVHRVKNARFARAWRPLVPVIEDAAVTGDGGGAATSWLTGRYRGHVVHASMSPDLESATGSTHLTNHFAVALQDVPGRHDWSVRGADGAVRGADAALEARLRDAGVGAVASRLGDAEVRYDARARTLTLREEIAARWTPPPARFREELDVLVALATLGREANDA